MFCADIDVVVAEDGVDAAAAEALENVCALPGGADGEFAAAELVRDVVAGEEDEVGIELVNAADSLAKKKGSVNSSRWMSLI